jgi:hypothetical protein
MLLSILREGITESFWSVLTLLAILTPIMIFFEYSRHYQLLENLSRYFSWLTRWLTLSPAAAFPLVIGMFFGILFSAAVLIEFSRQKLISGRDMILMGTFLSLNHSIVEDNLLFTAAGANFPMLLFSRFALALIVTRTMAWWIDSKSRRLKAALTPGNDQ